MKTTRIHPLKRLNEKGTLLKICEDCFTLILKMSETKEIGDSEALRDRLKRLLKNIEREAKDEGIDHEDMEFTLYALVASLDEVIIRSQWGQKDIWITKPLQLEFFGRYNAGEVFYAKLDELRKRPHSTGDVLQVYYFCLALGFKGMNLLEGKEKRKRIMEEICSDLMHANRDKNGMLSPHGQTKEEIMDVVKTEVPVWVIVVSAVSIGFSFYLTLTFLIRDAADKVIQLIQSMI
jgi:type VI secretion system protein ImpK